MAQPQNFNEIRALLNKVSTDVAQAGQSRSVQLAPGAVLVTIKALEFTLQHIEWLEGRIAALEAKAR